MLLPSACYQLLAVSQCARHWDARYARSSTNFSRITCAKPNLNRRPSCRASKCWWPVELRRNDRVDFT